MFEKIKSYQNHPYFTQFHDIRAWGLVIFGIIALMVTWSGIKAVQTNYTLQKQISRIQQENQVNELENNNLKLQNQYYNTDEYLDLAARRNFGLGAPGEKVLIVPTSVALAHTVNLDGPKTKASAKQESGNKPTYQKNFEAWVDFFLHRPHANN